MQIYEENIVSRDIPEMFDPWVLNMPEIIITYAEEFLKLHFAPKVPTKQIFKRSTLVSNDYTSLLVVCD